MAKSLRLSAFAVICNCVWMHRYTIANAILVQMLKANYLCSLRRNYGAIAKGGNIRKYFKKNKIIFYIVYYY
jgi:hypothetical protein